MVYTTFRGGISGEKKGERNTFNLAAILNWKTIF
jgi:hypothetical protein